MFRHIALLAALLAFGATAPAAAQAPVVSDSLRALQARSDSLVAVETRVHWVKTAPDTALAFAQKSGMPAFLDFYATWCAPCRWMDRVVYSDELLSEVAENVMMIRVDVDTPAGKALAARYDVTQYPTLVHLSPEGRETLRWVGPLNLRDMRINLGQAALPADRRADVVAAVAQHPADAMTQSSAVLYYGCRGEVENARAVVKKYEVMALEKPASEKAPVILSLGKAEEYAGRDDRAIDAYGRAISMDPNGVFAWRAWLGLSTCLERQGKNDDALTAARQAATRGPRMPFLEARVARLALGLPRPTAPPGVDDGPGAGVAH